MLSGLLWSRQSPTSFRSFALASRIELAKLRPGDASRAVDLSGAGHSAALTHKRSPERSSRFAAHGDRTSSFPSAISRSRALVELCDRFVSDYSEKPEYLGTRSRTRRVVPHSVFGEDHRLAHTAGVELGDLGAVQRSSPRSRRHPSRARARHRRRPETFGKRARL